MNRCFICKEKSLAPEEFYAIPLSLFGLALKESLHVHSHCALEQLAFYEKLVQLIKEGAALNAFYKNQFESA